MKLFILNEIHGPWIHCLLGRIRWNDEKCAMCYNNFLVARSSVEELRRPKFPFIHGHFSMCWSQALVPMLCVTCFTSPLYQAKSMYIHTTNENNYWNPRKYVTRCNNHALSRRPKFFGMWFFWYAQPRLLPRLCNACKFYVLSSTISSRTNAQTVLYGLRWASIGKYPWSTLYPFLLGVDRCDGLWSALVLLAKLHALKICRIVPYTYVVLWRCLLSCFDARSISRKVYRLDVVA